MEQVFYFRPPGFYQDRMGKKYEYTALRRNAAKEDCRRACITYADDVGNGQSYEHTRHGLPQNFRQDYTLAGTVEAIFHWLDRRTKADAQLEVRVLAEMVMQKLDVWIPPLAEWYRKERYGKAILAP